MHNEEKGGRYGIRPTRERTLQVIAKELRTAHDPAGTSSARAKGPLCFVGDSRFCWPSR